MKIYVDVRKERAFTRETLEKKVFEIVTNCMASHKTYDEFFDKSIPDMIDFLNDNLLAFEDLKTTIINEEYERIKDIREEYIDWCCQSYLDNLIYNILNEVELVGI